VSNMSPGAAGDAPDHEVDALPGNPG
jgi:hypothetical protein